MYYAALDVKVGSKRIGWILIGEYPTQNEADNATVTWPENDGVRKIANCFMMKNQDAKFVRVIGYTPNKKIDSVKIAKEKIKRALKKYREL